MSFAREKWYLILFRKRNQKWNCNYAITGNLSPLSKNKRAHEQNNIPEPYKRQPHKMVKHTQGQ